MTIKQFSITLASIFTLAFTAIAENEYNFVSTWNNGDYIQINEDLESFKITSNFGTVGGSGYVGYYTYDNTTTTREIVDSIKSDVKTGDNLYSKKDGGITISDVKAGDKIGFYLVKREGVYTNYRFIQTVDGRVGIAFDGWAYGAYSNAMLFNDIVVVSAANTAKTTGTPLPGFLPAFLVGMIGIGGSKLRKRFHRS